MLSNEDFYYSLFDAINRFALIELKNELTDEQRKVLAAMHKLLWNYCNTINE